MGVPFVAALLLGSALAVPPAPATGFEPAGEPPAFAAPANPMVSRLALLSSGITGFSEPSGPKKAKKPKAPRDSAAVNEGLGPERARILLRSLTMPGWGQVSLGHRGSARVFALAEAGIWGAFTAFKIQQAQRTDSYLLTARLAAGIDLHGRDDEFRRIVGAFASSDEYNLLVVARDAANIYLSDPAHIDLVGYRDYIAKHSLSGDMAWHWTDEESFRRYGGQRKFAQKAGLRANTALGLAVANRLVSALHAARLAGREAAAAKPQGWRLELSPGLDEPGRFRAALTTRF